MENMDDPRGDSIKQGQDTPEEGNNSQMGQAGHDFTRASDDEQVGTGMPHVPYQPLIVNGASLAEAWENAVRTMMSKGYNRFVRAPEYQTWTKDSPMIIMVSDPMSEPRLSPKSPITRSMADEYAESLIHGHTKDKENSFEYTYYSRLRHYPDCMIRAGLPHVPEGEKETMDYVHKVSGGKCVVQRLDQVAKAIEIFRKDPTRRTVVLHTWIPFRDLAKFTPERLDTSSPCLVVLHPQLVEDRLHFNVVMKTNDLFSAWPGNAYAFTALQKYMADQIGAGVGHYTHFSVSMQVYQEVFEAARVI
jgi:thymidylate synthase